MRVVGGALSGRRLAAPGGRDIRPTADRLRESLFNILAHGPPDLRCELAGGDVTVLDGFCGTGALGIEALSRGAAHAVFLDAAPASLALVRRNVAALGLADRVRMIRANALRPPPAVAAAGLVFLDPPYGKDLAGPALTALASAGWLAPAAKAVLELAERDGVPSPSGFRLLEQRRYGGTRVAFLAYGA